MVADVNLTKFNVLGAINIVLALLQESKDLSSKPLSPTSLAPSVGQKRTAAGSFLPPPPLSLASCSDEYHSLESQIVNLHNKYKNTEMI